MAGTRHGIRWIRNLMRRLASEGRTVVVSSHVLSELEATADRVLVLGRGRMIADASVDELTRRNGFVRVVSPDDALREVLNGPSCRRCVRHAQARAHRDPRRERLLAAKAAVVALVTLVAGTVMTPAMFLAAQAVLAGYGVSSSGLGDGDALRAVLATAVTSPVVPLFALSLGFMLRSTAGAITSVLGLLFVPATVGAILPQSWQDHVLIYLPGAASDALAFGQLPDAPHGRSPVPAALVLATWTALFLGGAWAALERCDA